MKPYYFTIAAILFALACGDSEPDIATGPSDALSNEACGAIPTTTTILTAAPDMATASDVVIQPGIPYEITVTGTGYVTLSNDIASRDWAFVMSPDSAIAGDGLEFSDPTLAAPSACQELGLWDFRTMIDTGSSLVLELDSPGTIWFYAARSDG